MPLRLFEAIGVEIEYAIVDAESLDVRPICDKLIATASGNTEACDYEPAGGIAWSNELALHVLEFKTADPAPTLDGLAAAFQAQVAHADKLLEPMGARLMPGGMHPWMDPSETRLWPHENNDIYRTYDRLFSCRGHGWGNLQSTHLNLPFSGDEEFAKLYAAVRLVLPLLPALAASSPVVDGRRSHLANHRLEVYRTNSTEVPLMAGLVIPEPTWSRSSFEAEVMEPLFADLRGRDAAILCEAFANARGGMARFDRGSVEIRLLDTQECPEADLAVAALVVETVKALVQERWGDWATQASADTQALHGVLLDNIRSVEATNVAEPTLLSALGVSAPTTAGEIWKKLAQELLPKHKTLHQLLSAGTLSTRLSRRLSPEPTRDELQVVWGGLADCLRHGTLFDA